MKSTFFSFAIIIVLLTGLSLSTLGQSVKITVKDDDKNPLMGATVQLIAIPDSTAYYATTNQNGTAILENIPDALYALTISFIGYQSLEKSIMIKADSRSFNYKLSEAAISLDEVTVIAKKPMITQEDDKMIIDPEPLVNISANTLEVLENTPGMYVDQDGGIFLNGATPAAIYINGREQKMSTQDISTILRSLPPGSVQRIEVMRTPSTKYDASTSGGIVNVILKQGVKIGRFGSARIGMNQGVYGNRFAGFSLNDSGEKSTGYINANYNWDERQEDLNVSRVLNLDTLLYQNAISRQKSHQIFTGYGINYDLSDKTNISYDGRINFNLPENVTNNTNYTLAAEDIRLTENQNTINNNSTFLSIQQDFGLNYKIDTSGSDWDTKLGYTYNNKNSDQDYIYNFTLPDIYSLNGNGITKQQRHFLLAQSDLTLKFVHDIKLETGLKSTLQLFGNDAEYMVNYGGIGIIDPLRTNAFTYKENINAGYFQISKTFFHKLIVKGGVRMEHTYMQGLQTVPNDTSFLINRADLFPYVYISHPVFKMKDFELNAFLIYRRTITRPDYEMLNPNVNYVDQFMYETGNPALKPQFSDNFEVNVSFEDFPVFAIGRNYTTDIFSGVVYQDPNYPDVAVRTYDNLGKSQETYLRGMVGIPPGGKYFFGIGGQFNRNEYDGFYEGNPLQYTRDSWRLYMFHMLRIFSDTKLTLSGFMMINGQMDFYELQNFGGLNVGIKQSFFDDKLTITINARDILRTMVVKYEINQGSIHAFGDRYTDNRRIGINILYTFGFGQKNDKGGMFNMEE